MDRSDLLSTIGRVLSRSMDVGHRSDVCEQMADLERVRRWVDAASIEAMDRLRQLGSADPTVVPVLEAAVAGRTDRRDAERLARRSEAVDMVPEMAAALRDGETSGRHVDVLSGALRSLEPNERREFVARGAQIAYLASVLTPNEFGKALAERARQVRTDGGVSRLLQQRRDTRLRMWTDRASGMLRLDGRFDPESGAQLLAVVRERAETLFHAGVPPTAPSDPLERNDHLNALALIDRVTNGGSGTAVSIGVLIDQQTLVDGLHGNSVIDVPGECDVPVETIRRWACEAGILPIVLGGDGLALDVGRERRLATRAQRWALRSMYSTCFVEHCDVPFDRCEIHHLNAWSARGSTDVAVMVPTCSGHHHQLHEGGWRLSIDEATREITITLPDGRTMTSRLHRRRSAG